MQIEQLIMHPFGVLTQISQHSTSYSPYKAAIHIDKVCVIDSVINRVNCVFTGILKRIYQINNRKIEKIVEYDTIIFTSKVSIKLSSIANKNIKQVLFLKDVAHIEMDVDLNKNDIPLIGIPNERSTEIYKFCLKYNLRYEMNYGSHLTL